MSIQEEIGRNIVELRKRKKMSQELLALESETAVSYFRSIEHGEANPTVEVLSRIAGVLDTPLDLLVTEGYADQLTLEDESRMSFTELYLVFQSQNISLCEQCREALEAERQIIRKNGGS